MGKNLEFWTQAEEEAKGQPAKAAASRQGARRHLSRPAILLPRRCGRLRPISQKAPPLRRPFCGLTGCSVCLENAVVRLQRAQCKIVGQSAVRAQIVRYGLR